jgi:Zn-dependent peptidase ImmA (M78 family)
LDIKKVVINLIKKYDTDNPFELADCLKIKVMHESLGHVRGFYQSCPKNKVIHLNNELDDLQRLLVCSHELGHAILHAKLNIVFIEKNTFYVKNKFEIEANKFASELLIQDGIMNKYPEYYTLEQIAACINMPKELLELKFI